MFTVVLLVVYSFLLGYLFVYCNARRSARVESLLPVIDPMAAMPTVGGVYYGPHFQTCHGCGVKIHSCGDNVWEPDQPLPRFILPLSIFVKCDPVYYHANCEKAQVAIYTRDGWCDIAIREYFQTDRRPPPVAMDHCGSSSSQENMDSLEV